MPAFHARSRSTVDLYVANAEDAHAAQAYAQQSMDLLGSGIMPADIVGSVNDVYRVQQLPEGFTPTETTPTQDVSGIYPVKDDDTEASDKTVWMEIVPTAYGIEIIVHAEKPAVALGADSPETAMARVQVDFFGNRLRTFIWKAGDDILNGDYSNTIVLVDNVGRWQPPHEN